MIRTQVFGLKISLLFVTLCHLFCVVSAVTIVVNDPNQGLADVLASSSDGDTIQIRAGTYSGPRNCNMIVARSRVSIVGVDGAAVTIVDCLGASRCLSVLGSGVRVSGVSFVNGRAPNTAGSVGGLRERPAADQVGKVWR